MSKLVGLSGIRRLDQFKSSSLGAAKTFQIPSYSNSSGSFANLKLTAEKLVKEQASAKTDLDLAKSKLKKLSEHIRALEEKLQSAYNENAKLKVKHKEDEKLWKGLEAKFSSTKTLCDQLTETLHLLADQVQDAEKDKEERQRALLQLQWKVMGDEPREDQEVTSKKDLPYINVTQSPVSNLLKKAEKTKTGSVISIPKHSKKVTHHEYEVETSHGRTITKRRKTKSTIMFQDPTKNKRRTPKANTPRDVITRIKGGSQQNPPNIGDLFSEGSLNPYADDPYTFD